jgi:hypothetical protein
MDHKRAVLVPLQRRRGPPFFNFMLMDVLMDAAGAKEE